MAAGNTTPVYGRRPARLTAFVCGLLAAGASTIAVAQQVVNPGDIIVEREITPRSAFDHVPTSQDPVQVRATTFPANSFDPTMAAVVSDAELTTAHGSAGVAPNGATAAVGAGVQALTSMLAGQSTGGGIAFGSTGQTQGLGGTISSAMTGALSPLTAVLGAVR